MCQTRYSHRENGDLTVQQIMAEPIVRDLMRADHVDPAAFEALLRSVAARSSVDIADAGPQCRGVAWFRSATSLAAHARLLPRRR
jgi:hypothetical protein